MILNFGDYKRIVYNDDDKEYDATKDQQLFDKYKYDADYFHKLVNTRQFETAANYASYFMPKDNKARLQLETEINKIRNKGHIITEQYSRIDNDSDRDMVEFYDSVFIPKALDYLSKNNYARQFSRLKENFFTLHSGQKAVNKYEPADEESIRANHVSIEFQPKKREGIFGWDWIAKDNNAANIEEFYKFTGYNNNYLREHGVDVIEKDGRTTLLFSKNDAISNELLYQFNSFRRGLSQYDTSIGFNSVRPKIQLANGDRSDPEHMTYYDANIDNNLSLLWQAIEDAKDKKDNVLSSFGEKELEFTSIISNYTNDAIRELQDAYHNSNGQMSYSEFNKLYKQLGGDAFLDLLAQSGTADQEMYSNYNNKEWTDQTIEPLEQADKSAVIQLIGANKDRVSQAAMFMNGQYGTLVTINGIAKPNKDLSLENDAEGELQDNRLQVFFPGLGQEKAQEAIERNTSTRAAQELNDMTNWEYSYKLDDGSELLYAGKITEGPNAGESRFIHKDDKNKTSNEVSKYEAYRLLNESMILESAKRNLKYNHMNNNGRVVDFDGYEQEARMTALQAAEELYPGLPIRDFSGNYYDINDDAAIEAIFNHAIDDNNIQFDVYEKLHKIYSIYDKIMAALNSYNYR